MTRAPWSVAHLKRRAFVGDGVRDALGWCPGDDSARTPAAGMGVERRGAGEEVGGGAQMIGGRPSPKQFEPTAERTESLGSIDRTNRALLLLPASPSSVARGPDRGARRRGIAPAPPLPSRARASGEAIATPRNHVDDDGGAATTPRRRRRRRRRRGGGVTVTSTRASSRTPLPSSPPLLLLPFCLSFHR